MVASLECQDTAYIQLLTSDSAEAVLAGKRLPEIPEAVVAEVKKESWLTRAFGRRSYQVKAI
jgi:hypothetical protein